MTKIKIGSVVKLKGQNVKMTVNSIVNPSQEQQLYTYAAEIELPTIVGCVWFIDSVLYKSEFNIDALELWSE